VDIEIKKKNGLYTIVTYLLVFNIVSLLISAIVVSVLKSFNMNIEIQENENLASSIVNLLVYIVLIIGIGYFNLREVKTDIKEFVKDKENIIIKIFAAYGIFLVINFFVSSLITNIEVYYNLTSDILGNNPINTTAENQTAIEQILHSKGFWMMFLSAGILGPICEEVVFRKAFFNICETKEMGILLSSICFGLIHITSSIGQYDILSMILMTIPYITSGIAFGIIYIKNDCNIVVPTIVHMLSNIISMLGIIFLK
jgi:membrane protease YdiL (CAAX protease family)